MRNSLDFSSWQSLLSTLLGLLLATLLMLGIRLVFMQTLQRKRERENRQINERLKTLIAAYKTLGSSFTGELGVDPSHLRDLRAASGTMHGRYLCVAEDGTAFDSAIPMFMLESTEDHGPPGHTLQNRTLH